VGVTPFINLSGDRTNDYFSEGVTQEIAGALGRVPGLRVAFHNPAIAAGADEAPTDPRALGRSLRVETVLQGTVQHADNRVRITARLVNTADGYQLWSEKFDREMADVFALQDEVARAIAGGLQLALAPGGRDTLVRVTTTDPEAHLLYLRGMYFWNRRGSENIYKSVTLFHGAVERDPSFARAWAGIALAYAVVVTWDDVDVPTTLARAVEAADRALALDSSTSEAWTAIAKAKSSLWENAAASAAFERAIALDPNNATAHQWYGEHLGRLGRVDEGLAHIRRAQQLAPLSLVVNTQEGRLEVQARRFGRAKAALARVLELDSTYRTAHTLLGAAHLQEGSYARAIASFQRALELSGRRRSLDLSFLAHAYATAGQRDSARALLAELEARRRAREPFSYAGLALVYESLGDRKRAIAMLDTAVMRYDPLLGMHASEAVFDPLRGDQRGARVLAPVVGHR
jgi:TolB-like protein/Tfp pilus assembly protein PilF